jgi:hypothetical protein
LLFKGDDFAHTDIRPAGTGARAQRGPASCVITKNPLYSRVIRLLARPRIAISAALFTTCRVRLEISLTLSIMMSDTNRTETGHGKAPGEENCPPEPAIHWSQTT